DKPARVVEHGPVPPVEASPPVVVSDVSVAVETRRRRSQDDARSGLVRRAHPDLGTHSQRTGHPGDAKPSAGGAGLEVRVLALAERRLPMDGDEFTSARYHLGDIWQLAGFGAFDEPE